MSYVLMQAGMEAPDRDALKRAFGEAPGMVALDAFSFGPDAYGMLARCLAFEQATKLKNSLASQGAETEVLAESELPPLPDARIVHQLDCTPDALLVYDALGRSSPVPWRDISIIAAGCVLMAE